jgi:hypothetical protein
MTPSLENDQFRVAIFDRHEFKVQKIKNRPARILDTKSLGLETSLDGTSRDNDT